MKEFLEAFKEQADQRGNGVSCGAWLYTFDDGSQVVWVSDYYTPFVGWFQDMRKGKNCKRIVVSKEMAQKARKDRVVVVVDKNFSKKCLKRY